ncbi:hypothetical protein [Gordonia ajococcus]|uniref:hypothetical protein n=1 Tax=Gordonia ajococcus TaxID=1292359 RepID=UPI0017868FD9|nr:hypothetical protein [Gordonia ajococcus]
MFEQVAVEREIAARLIADAPAGPAPADLVSAVGHLEAELTKVGWGYARPYAEAYWRHGGPADVEHAAPGAHRIRP